MFKVENNVYLTMALLADRYYDVMLDEINDQILKSSEHRDFIVIFRLLYLSLIIRKQLQVKQCLLDLA